MYFISVVDRLTLFKKNMIEKWKISLPTVKDYKFNRNFSVLNEQTELIYFHMHRIKFMLIKARFVVFYIAPSKLTHLCFPRFSILSNSFLNMGNELL